MKTAIKEIKAIRTEVTESKAWSMLTYKKELLADVPQEDLADMVINLSNTLSEAMYELSDLETYLRIKSKYGE